MAPPRIPRATYRLQLHAGFTLADAEALVPYLAALGVSHLYLSPISKARPGSQHGYDLVDHNSVNPELGGMAALERLAGALARHHMGIVLDIVPNHMGVGGADNGWWLDVLEWGEDSPYARFFDIDWQPARRDLKGKLLLPFLGEHYGDVLERGELVPRFDRHEGTISVWYWQHRFPIAVKDYTTLLEPAVRALGETPDGDALAESMLDFRALSQSRHAQSRRARAVEAKARLAGVATAHPAVGEAVDAALTAMAGEVGVPSSRRALHRLLEAQHYRLCYWRVAADEVNYRRFFDINDLAALRMVEEPDLFRRAHRLVLDLLRRGIVHGLRIDHVDGLFNPAEYCRQLQARAGEALGIPAGEGDGRPLYLAVEKILARHEAIRRDWPVAGTSGYDFLNLVNGLLVDPEGEEAMDLTWRRFIGFAMDFDAEVRAAKMRIIDEHMTSELRVLAGRLGRIAASHWRSRDFTLSLLYRALQEVVACMPVYRTYITSRRVTDNDLRYIHWAVARARKLSGLDPSVLNFVEGVMDTRLSRDPAGAYSRRAVVDFAMRIQQYTGPVMAKGFEDTALYRFNRLLALNEVGGDPTRFGLTPAAFHQAMRVRVRALPHALLATATHDTKRGEDTRARIAVLSELPEEWRQHLERWSQLNAPFRKDLESGPAPEPGDEYLLYQLMLGAWPDEAGNAEGFTERLVPVAVKGVKEAKRRTSWVRPDAAYEQAVADFVRRILERGRRNPFLDDFIAFHRRLMGPGMVGGLVQTLLKLTCPGVPDIYQGCEVWDLSMVDPDNRRPVDFDRRRQMLGRLSEGPLPADIAAWRDGAVKQELIRRVLHLRRSDPELFDHGAYRPLAVRGAWAGHVLAFARQWEQRQIVVAVPLRLVRLWPQGQSEPPLGAAWRGVHVELPRRGAAVAGRWRDVFTGRLVEPAVPRASPVLLASDLFAAFPLALLEPCGD